MECPTTLSRHHLRELQALIVIEKEPWATYMKNLVGLTPKPVAEHPNR